MAKALKGSDLHGGLLIRPLMDGREEEEDYRAIRTGQLHALPRVHTRPIDVMVYHGS